MKLNDLAEKEVEKYFNTDNGKSFCTDDISLNAFAHQIAKETIKAIAKILEDELDPTKSHLDGREHIEAITQKAKQWLEDK